MSVKEAIEENGDTLSSMSTTLSSMLTLLQAASRHETIPSDAIPFSAMNATAVALIATPQTIKAAVANKRHWITQSFGINLTSGDDAANVIQDEDDVVAIPLIPADAGSVSKEANAGKNTYDPPLVIASGKAIEAGALKDLGDVHIGVIGYQEA